MPGDLRIEHRGDIAILTLSRPAKRNALTPQLCATLAEAVSGFGADGVRAAVLAAAGDKAFCAGFDVSALPEAHDVDEIHNHPFAPMIEAVAACTVPIVAALNGPAHGGGCELAATCDLRVGHPGVSMSMPPAKLGIMYAPRGLARLSAVVGESRARNLFLTARVVAAEEAERWGLLDRVVAAERVLPEAVDIASTIARHAPLAVQGMRRAFEQLVRHHAALPAAVAAELERLRVQTWQSTDAAEARAAFAEKRKPTFRGA